MLMMYVKIMNSLLKRAYVRSVNSADRSRNKVSIYNPTHSPTGFGLGLFVFRIRGLRLNTCELCSRYFHLGIMSDWFERGYSIIMKD